MLRCNVASEGLASVRHMSVDKLNTGGILDRPPRIGG